MKSFREKWEFPLSQIIEIIITLCLPEVAVAVQGLNEKIGEGVE